FALHRPVEGLGGYLHCGPSGAGHFVKLVHNGIEYGLMAAYPREAPRRAEGPCLGSTAQQLARSPVARITARP
ncbi:MAG TPA: hypothetical protein VE782_12855, partial [Myxococcaceae bacterium]|nr:hypothetical protein [Myxococcaceae bacterium]